MYVCVMSPVSALQTCAVLPSFPVASCLPSGLQATARIPPEFPSKSDTAHLCTSHTRKTPSSSLAVANTLGSTGLQDTESGMSPRFGIVVNNCPVSESHTRTVPECGLTRSLPRRLIVPTEL